MLPVRAGSALKIDEMSSAACTHHIHLYVSTNIRSHFGSTYAPHGVQASPDLERYVNALVEARKHKGLKPDQARDALGDPNTFGVMMVQTGDSDGMVSGAAHTTAATIRPALQVRPAYAQNGHVRYDSSNVCRIFCMRQI